MAKKLGPVILIGLTILCLRLFPVFLGKTLYFGDNYSLLVPGRVFTAGWLKQGVLPLWNPTILGGLSWVGDIGQSIIYPTTLIFMLFQPAMALNITVGIHLLITFVGMYCLAFSWVKKREAAMIASAMWLLSTQMTGNINNLATLQSLAWLPWVVLAGQAVSRRRDALLWFPLFVTLQLWGGYPQHTIFGVGLAILFSWLQRSNPIIIWLKHWLLAGVLTIGLSASLLFPFIETLTASTRSIQSTVQALAGSFKPAMIGKVILPYLFDMPRLGMRWGPAWSGQYNLSFYLTWFGLLVIIAGLAHKKNFTRQNIFLVSLILISLILALGDYLPGYRDWYMRIPLIKFGRYPSMILLITNFLLCLLVAQLLPTLKFTNRVYRTLMLTAGIIGGLALVLWGMWYWRSELSWLLLNNFSGQRLADSTFHTLAKDTQIFRIITGNLLVNAGFFLLALYTFRKGRMGLLLGVIVLDMVVNTAGMLFWANREIYAPVGTADPKLSQAVNRLSTPQTRWLTRNMNQPYTDFGMYWEALTIRPPFSDSFVNDNEIAKNYTLIRMKEGYTPDWNMPANLPVINGYTTLLPKQTAIIWNTSADSRINFLGTIQPDSTQLAQWAVKYYLIDKWFMMKEDLSWLPIVYEDESFAIREIPGALPRIRYENGQAPKISDYRENPNQIAFNLENSDTQPLIVADNYDKSWQVYIDGLKVTLTNSQGMQRVTVPAGRHTLVYRYQPVWFYIGTVISVVTLLGLIWFFRRREFRRGAGLTYIPKNQTENKLITPAAD